MSAMSTYVIQDEADLYDCGSPFDTWIDGLIDDGAAWPELTDDGIPVIATPSGPVVLHVGATVTFTGGTFAVAPAGTP